MASRPNISTRPEILDDRAAASVAITAWQQFDDALFEYQKARAASDAAKFPIDADLWIDDIVNKVDEALDRLLRTDSPNVHAFHIKLRILEAEYGRDWQPRHIDYLLADARLVDAGRA